MDFPPIDALYGTRGTLCESWSLRNESITAVDLLGVRGVPVDGLQNERPGQVHLAREKQNS